jgi:hypothetical protein
VGERVASSSGMGLYVDELVCADCHADQATGYQTTGHADTFRLSQNWDVARQLDGQVVKDPEREYSYNYHYNEENGLTVSLPEQFGEDRFPLTYAFGSGHNAITFLSLIPNRLGDTVGIEHRISLYRGEAGWEYDLTPSHAGVAAGQDVEHFGNVIRGDKLEQCVGCHTMRAEITGDRLTKLSPNVGCQSCHGPGREHVIAMESGGRGGYAGFTQQTALEEIQMCGRCHRFSPSDSPEEISPDNIRIVRFQSVGLVQSQCYKQNSDRLKCTTCHSPHQAVSRDASHYVARCLNCHSGARSTTCPVSPRENCIQCHMPAIDVHRGIKFHDHWIRVRNDVDRSPPSR